MEVLLRMVGGAVNGVRCSVFQQADPWDLLHFGSIVAVFVSVNL